ncbi:MAG: adenylate kinase [Elusimicrobia bacterium]|nr:adenylate kinase [Elusimicrobiota bacterium]
MSRIFVFLGIPGAGKGTQAKRLSNDLNIPYIGTGDILRRNVQEKTPLGLKVKELLDRGELVDDETMIEIIKNEIKNTDSFILDGFPRTVPQAKALDNLLNEFGKKISCVFFLDVSDQEVIKRILARYSCVSCGKEFNLYLDEISDKKCPVCGSELKQRSDDNEQTLKERISQYRTKTQPLVDFYRQKDLLKVIRGEGSPDEIFSQIKKVISRYDNN